MPEKIILNIPLDDAFRSIPVGHTKGYELVNAGKIKTVKIGRKRFVPYKNLLEFQEELEKNGSV